MTKDEEYWAYVRKIVDEAPPIDAATFVRIRAILSSTLPTDQQRHASAQPVEQPAAPRTTPQGPAVTNYYAPEPAEPGVDTFDELCGGKVPSRVSGYRAGDWGPWILDADRQSLMYPMCGNYEINLCDAARRDWLTSTFVHIMRKNWPNEAIGGLIRAIDDIFGIDECVGGRVSWSGISLACSDAAGRWPTIQPDDERLHHSRFAPGFHHAAPESAEH